jgi:hypothetical protein
MNAVSVIASIHNSEKYLKTFFENCLEQTAFDRTLFIFCFSSPSNHEISIIDSYRAEFQSNAIFLIENELITVYEAWNRCLSHVESQYVAIWNVDDVRTADSLAKQEEVMNNSSATSVSGPFIIVDTYGKRDGKYINHSGSKKVEFMRGMRHGPFFMFRADAIEILKGFDEQFRIASDFDFCIRLSSIGSVGYTSELLGFYLNNRAGVSTGAGFALARERESIYMRYGIFDKFDLSHLRSVLNYDLTRIKVRGLSIPIKDTLIDYEQVCKSLCGDIDIVFWWKKINREIFLIVKRSIIRKFLALVWIFD